MSDGTDIHVVSWNGWKAAAALVAAVLVWGLLTLPPVRVSLGAADWRPTSFAVPGAFHVHTRRSDGSGSVAQVAAAAARVGLKFLIFTDHGDATRAPALPVYRFGVLCLDGVEVSTTDGHYIALDLPAAPYPLAGEARDVAEDVTRLGGFGVAAHPESGKSELQWHDWQAPLNGIEWLNADSQWRDETVLRMARVPFDYLFRGTGALTALFDRPTRELARWDRLTQGGPVIALAGADAHGRVGFRGLGLFPFPSYESSFRTFATYVEIDRPLTGEAPGDAQEIWHAIRAGRSHTVIESLAGPGAFEFTGRSGGFRAGQGQPLRIGGPIELRARVLAPPGARIVLLKNGGVLSEVVGSQLTHTEAAGSQAVFRVEVRLSASTGRPRVPWIVSHPIYVGFPDRTAAPQPVRPTVTEAFPLGPSDRPGAWTVEHDASSRASVEPGARPDEILFQYALGGGPRAGQFTAIAVPVTGQLGNFERLAFRAWADRPMRLSIQLRKPSAAEGERWHRSVYLDQSPRLVTVGFDDMRPIGTTSTARPDRPAIDALLFVVDTTNTASGARGRIWLDAVRRER